MASFVTGEEQSFLN